MRRCSTVDFFPFLFMGRFVINLVRTIILPGPRFEHKTALFANVQTPSKCKVSQPTLKFRHHVVLISPQGFTRISEDSSEIAFLLVENYNYDHSCWPSGRLGIFGQKRSFARRDNHLFIARGPLRTAAKKRLLPRWHFETTTPDKAVDHSEWVCRRKTKVLGSELVCLRVGDGGL